MTSEYATAEREIDDRRQALIGTPLLAFKHNNGGLNEQVHQVIWLHWWSIIDGDAVITGWLNQMADFDGYVPVDVDVKDGHLAFSEGGVDAVMALDDWLSFCEPVDVVVSGDPDTGWRSRND